MKMLSMAQWVSKAQQMVQNHSIEHKQSGAGSATNSSRPAAQLPPAYLSEQSPAKRAYRTQTFQYQFNEQPRSETGHDSPAESSPTAAIRQATKTPLRMTPSQPYLRTLSKRQRQMVPVRAPMVPMRIDDDDDDINNNNHENNNHGSDVNHSFEPPDEQQPTSSESQDESCRQDSSGAYYDHLAGQPRYINHDTRSVYYYDQAHASHELSLGARSLPYLVEAGADGEQGGAPMARRRPSGSGAPVEQPKSMQALGAAHQYLPFNVDVAARAHLYHEHQLRQHQIHCLPNGHHHHHHNNNHHHQHHQKVASNIDPYDTYSYQLQPDGHEQRVAAAAFAFEPRLAHSASQRLRQSQQYQQPQLVGADHKQQSSQRNQRHLGAMQHSASRQHLSPGSAVLDHSAASAHGLAPAGGARRKPADRPAKRAPHKLAARQVPELTLGCCGKLARLVLFLSNILFWLAGISLSVWGILSLVDDHKYNLSQLLVFEPNARMSLFQLLSWSFIALGAGSILVGFCGCSAIFKNNRWILGLYIFLILAIFALDLATGLLAIIFQERLITNVRLKLAPKLRSDYGVQASFTAAIDYIQTRYECCGLEGHFDYDQSLWRLQRLGGFEATVARTCCHLRNKLDDHAHVNPRPVNESMCQSSDSRFHQSYRYRKGCLDDLERLVRHKIWIFYVSCGAVGAVILVSLLFATCFCRSIPTPESRKSSRESNSMASGKLKKVPSAASRKSLRQTTRSAQ